MRPFLAGVLLFLSVCGSAAAQTPHTHHHRFTDAERWSQVFDDPARDAWQKPHEVIQALRLPPHAVVADIGAGTGYFSARLAHMTPQGKVYAVDAEPDMVKYLAARFEKDGLRNARAVHGQPADPRLPEPVDLVLLVDVYHHVEQREQYFRNLARRLKPGGRIAIIDFTESSPVGPPRAARVPPAQVRAEMDRAGYALIEEHGFLPNQYFLIFGLSARR